MSMIRRWWLEFGWRRKWWELAEVYSVDEWVLYRVYKDLSGSLYIKHPVGIRIYRHQREPYGWWRDRRRPDAWDARLDNLVDAILTAVATDEYDDDNQHLRFEIRGLILDYREAERKQPTRQIT